MNGNAHPRPGLHPGDRLALALLLLWTVVLFARIHVGFECTDEGLYLAATDRLVHGDLPFRDEHETPLRQFDLLMAWLWTPFGGFSLLAFRVAGLAMQLAQMVALWALVRRWRGPWIAVLATCLMPCVPLYARWEPNYNDLSCSAAVVAACCLALAGAGVNRRASAWMAVGAGVLLAVAWLTYAPMVALGLLPLAMAGWGLWRGSVRHPWVLAGATALGTAVLLVALHVGIICARGLGPDWLAATREMVFVEDRYSPLATRFLLVYHQIRQWSGPLAEVFGLLIGLRLLVGRWGARPAVGAVAALVPVGVVAVVVASLISSLSTPSMAWFRDSFWALDFANWLALVGVAGFLVFVGPAACRPLWRGDRDGAAMAALAGTVILAYGTIQMVSATVGLFNFCHVRAALYALAVAGGAAWIADAGPAWRRPLVLSGLAGHGLFVALAALSAWQLVFGDAHPAACTATFTHAPMTGIRSTPERVAAVTALQDWTTAHVPSGERILAYHEVPGLYFVLQRRPVLTWTWTSTYFCPSDASQCYALNAQLLATMDQRRLHPAACVQLLEEWYSQDGPGWPLAYRLNDPIHAYVVAHFVPAWRHWPYTAWLPRDPAHPPPAPDLIGDPASGRHDPAVDIVPGPGVIMKPLADGGIALDAPGDFAQPLLQILEYGGDEVTLRLQVGGDSGAATVEMIRGDRHHQLPLYGYAGPELGPGWDVTFPAGAPEERGFAIVPAAPVSAAPRRFILDRLRLERLPGPATSAQPSGAP